MQQIQFKLCSRTVIGKPKREISDAIVPHLIEPLLSIDGLLEAHLLMIFQPEQMSAPLPALVVRFRSGSYLRKGVEKLESSIKQDMLLIPLNWWSSGIYRYRGNRTLIYRGPKPWWHIWDDGQKLSHSVPKTQHP